MAASDRISGKDVYVSFGGTEIHGDYTSVGIREVGESVDLTAGADAVHYYVPIRKDGTIDFEAFFNASTLTVWNALEPNSTGTLIIAPKGTAAGSPKLECARAVVNGRDQNAAFDGDVRVTATFQMSAELSSSTY